MSSDHVFATALLGGHADATQFVHGGQDESPSGPGGANLVAAPDISAAGTDIHATMIGHYQALIEGTDASISPHVIMRNAPEHPAAALARHIERRAYKSNHRDYHH